MVNIKFSYIFEQIYLPILNSTDILFMSRIFIYSLISSFDGKNIKEHYDNVLNFLHPFFLPMPCIYNCSIFGITLNRWWGIWLRGEINIIWTQGTINLNKEKFTFSITNSTIFEFVLYLSMLLNIQFLKIKS